MEYKRCACCQGLLPVTQFAWDKTSADICNKCKYLRKQLREAAREIKQKDAIAALWKGCDYRPDNMEVRD